VEVGQNVQLTLIAQEAKSVMVAETVYFALLVRLKAYVAQIIFVAEHREEPPVSLEYVVLALIALILIFQNAWLGHLIPALSASLDWIVLLVKFVMKLIVVSLAQKIVLAMDQDTYVVMTSVFLLNVATMAIAQVAKFVITQVLVYSVHLEN
jgi:hypothetical protein